MERQPLRIITAGPERLFRVTGVAAAEAVVSASMPVGAWLEGSDGQPAAGSLGVLVDNVLGYGVMVDRPVDHWSVSSEISIDLCHPIAPDSHLFAEARPVYSDSQGAVSSGRVVDDQGRLIALCRQHGRFLSPMPPPPTPREAGGAADRGECRDVFDLLGASPATKDEGAVLDLTARSALTNPLANLHGGITLCVADLTAQAALQTSGRALATASVHVAYLRPIPLGAAVRFEASVLHAGRTFGVVRVTARTEDDRPCAAATVTAGAR